MAFVMTHEGCTYRSYARGSCTRRAVVTEDGRGYCRQHAPSAFKARREASDARYTREAEARRARDKEASDARRRAEYAMEACKALIYPRDPDHGNALQAAIDAARIALRLDPLPTEEK